KKMSRAQAESVIKNIIREIAQQCASRGQAVSETLVAFMVKAVVLDPTNDFSTDKTLTRDDVQKLIKLCVDKLMDTKSPSLDTIKMQVFFDMNYTARREFLEEHHRIMKSRLMPVMREITDSRARTRDELDSLYRKIVSAVLLQSGLGSPTDINVVREATAALQSVFPQSELGAFMQMPRKDKERHLQELTAIVSGIRLFNKDCGKGGEGIDDLPSFLNEGIPATTHSLDEEIGRVQETAAQYAALIESLAVKAQKPGADVGLSLELLRESLINCRQAEVFLKVLLSDVIRSADQVEQLMQQLQARLEQLQNTVQSKTAVPTAQVYPQFVHLSEIWSGFQDEMVLLSVLTNILNNLDAFSRVHRDLFKPDIVAPFLEEAGEVRSDQQRLEASSDPAERVNPADFRDREWLFPETTKNYSRLPVMYRGYCAWALVVFDRLLIPGNPSVGILHYRNNYFIFSSRKAAYEFANQPDEFITSVANTARRSPELIQILELHSQFAALTPHSQSRDAGKMIEKPVTKCDAQTETDTHFMDTNIVKSYEWNEWELRRKAIKLANLRTKVTHSQQTNLSNLRRDNVAQVYPPKDQETQTKRDGHTSVPKPSVFYAGLRGMGMSEPTDVDKLDLTVPVEQQVLGSNNGRPS
ncbi:hypothetical protein BOX15_Mlig012917g1, partial [Macrostomum lignano]